MIAKRWHRPSSRARPYRSDFEGELEVVVRRGKGPHTDAPPLYLRRREGRGGAMCVREVRGCCCVARWRRHAWENCERKGGRFYVHCVKTRVWAAEIKVTFDLILFLTRHLQVVWSQEMAWHLQPSYLLLHSSFHLIITHTPTYAVWFDDVASVPP